MSSSEELSRYEEKSTKTFKSLNSTSEEHDLIEKDNFGLYGVHVSNLPDNISEKLLAKTFSSVGHVAICKLVEVKGRCTDSSNQPDFFGYAFVKFTSSKEAHRALSKFDGYKLNGSTLAVRPAYVGEKYRKQPSSSAKQHHNDKSSEEGSSSSDSGKKEERQETKYIMDSSDCRLKDGRLRDSDIMIYNGTSNAASPPKKGNGGREVPPRFRKDSPSVTASHDSRNIQGAPAPTRVSDAPPAPNVPRQNGTVHKHPTSDFQTYPDNFHNSTAGSNSAGSSAFRPYQGQTSASFQETGMQKPGTIENSVASVASSFSHLGLPSPKGLLVENNNAATWNHSQGSGDGQSWRQGAAQGVTSWSAAGGTGVTSWSNGRDRPITSPERSQSGPEWKPQARAVSCWSTTDVVQFFLSSDCAEYAGFFQEQEIDGKALLLLNRDTLLHFMKVGPALKVLQLIDGLRACGSPPMTGSSGW